SISDSAQENRPRSRKNTTGLRSQAGSPVSLPLQGRGHPVSASRSGSTDKQKRKNLTQMAAGDTTVGSRPGSRRQRPRGNKTEIDFLFAGDSLRGSGIQPFRG